MPHVIVKLYPGRDEETLNKLANEIMKDVVSIAGCEEKFVSVAVEEVDPSDWPEKVYKPDIMGKEKTLIIRPGYILLMKNILERSLV